MIIKVDATSGRLMNTINEKIEAATDDYVRENMEVFKQAVQLAQDIGASELQLDSEIIRLLLS